MEFNVLSLFDGMSCGQQALDRNSTKVDNYYASEIDKYAIKVTMSNYPNTIQLGSVTGVDVSKLKPISLLIGGSPCQSFSFAGKRKGMSTKDNIEILTLEHYLELKSQNFEFEGQSYLFWEYMRILTDIRKYNPGVKFLLENVMMGAKWQKILSQAIGINPIEINSALVSAQNRRRLYWTNIRAEQDGLFGDLKCMIPQPKDKGILLKDILEIDVSEKYYISQKMIDRIDKSYNGSRCFDDSEKPMCLAAGYYKQGRDNQLVVHNMMPRSGDPKKGGTGHLSRTDGKTYCLDTGNTNAVEIVAMRGRHNGQQIEQMLESRDDGKTNCITTVQKDNLVYTENYIQCGDGFAQDNRAKVLIQGCDFRTDEGFRFKEDGKTGTLAARARNDESCGQLASINSRIRRLTPLECERLQTVKENYTAYVSDSQRYKMIGNGWNVDTIVHIFNYLK